MARSSSRHVQALVFSRRGSPTPLYISLFQDLLDPQNSYILKDTGQGLHRVQQAGKIYKAISKILLTTQQKVNFSEKFL